MKKNNLISRTILFVISLFIIALGVALITRANLGTSPAACPPYVLNLIPGSIMTMGTYMCCMQVMFVLAQIAILRQQFEPFQLFQFAASFLFGFYTDIAMMLTDWIPVGAYALNWLWLVAGCAVMGAGIVLEIQASLLLLPGEGVVAAISKVSHWQFHTIKIINDVVMTLTGIIIAWVMTGGIEGVREGTVVSAFLVGIMVKLFKHPLQPVETWVNR
ncbi:YczE/YyaS/YitT family protein [Bacteroides acidifaciens]|uniref:YczE/YyaS/YitT family protein n=1 Tax=Bacteroides acidifaciens TaxID=85831 RepID=UPI00263A95BD|nr:DUF6198 family protein [Bacteroides acidifaciens]